MMGSKFTLTLLFVVAAVASGTASAAGNSTPQGLKADGQRWQGIARVYQQLDSRPGTSFNTSDARMAEGQRLEGIADVYRRLNNSPAATFYTPEALKAQGQRWQAVANAYRSPVSVSSRSGFNWGDAGIGAVGGIGFAVCAAALILTARRIRRTKLAL
jgi:hypothetical protein